MFRFDLQQFNLGGGGQEINTANDAYTTLINQGQTIFGAAWPMIQGLITQGQSVLSGAPNPLSEAAMAPVQAQTSQEVNSLQGQLGGVANPGSVIQSIMQNGQQTAGLSADELLSSVYSAMMSLGGGLVNQAGQNINAGAGGEANIGTNLNASATNFWSGIFSDIGAAVGMKGGKGGGNPPASSGTNNSTAMTGFGAGSTEQQYGFGSPSGPGFYNTAPPTTAPPGASVNSSGGSTPLSGSGTSSASPTSGFYVPGINQSGP